jgi:hypothetical protein
LTGDAIVFVYNADSGLFNALADAAHKLLSPRTYRCNLCALTHSHLRGRREWRDFVAALPAPAEFLHADELRARYGIDDAPLPAVFRRAGARLEPLISAGEIDACRTLGELKALVAARTR